MICLAHLVPPEGRLAGVWCLREGADTPTAYYPGTEFAELYGHEVMASKAPEASWEDMWTGLVDGVPAAADWEIVRDLDDGLTDDEVYVEVLALDLRSRD